MATGALPADTPTDRLVGGEWVSGDARFEVIDPADLRVLATVPDADAAEALEAVDAAAAAFEPWAARPARERSAMLRRAFELMTTELEDCARLIVLENGKAWDDAMAEARYAADFLRWFAEEAVRVEGGFRDAPAHRAVDRPHPRAGGSACGHGERGHHHPATAGHRGGPRR